MNVSLNLSSKLGPMHLFIVDAGKTDKRSDDILDFITCREKSRKPICEYNSHMKSRTLDAYPITITPQSARQCIDADNSYFYDLARKFIDIDCVYHIHVTVYTDCKDIDDSSVVCSNCINKERGIEIVVHCNSTRKYNNIPDISYNFAGFNKIIFTDNNLSYQYIVDKDKVTAIELFKLIKNVNNQKCIGNDLAIYVDSYTNHLLIATIDKPFITANIEEGN